MSAASREGRPRFPLCLDPLTSARIIGAMNDGLELIYDLMEATPLRFLFLTHRRWIRVLLAVLFGGLLALGVGWLVAEVGALLALIVLLGLGVALWGLLNVEVAYLGVIAVVTLLPFASFPLHIGFTPTFLDGAIGLLFLAWLMPLLLARRDFALTPTPLDVPVLVFLLLAIGSFVAGLAHAAVTPYLLRHFAEVLLSIASFYLVVNTVRSRERLERLLRFFLFAATAEALIGIVLYVLPDETAVRVLSALGRVGYPTGAGVLRFIMDDPSQMQRATATSVDPNVLGSLLNLSLVLAVAQLYADRPIIRRRYLLPMIAILALGLGLTISRGSMFGAAVAISAVALLRYRRLIPWMVVVLILLLLLPQTQGLVQHFIAGVEGQDLSTKMRFGEYKDALILIRRYPILGVGFAGAPDIDTYIGVSSVYLLIAEEMGLVGLSCFFLILLILFLRFWRRREIARSHTRLEPLWYGLHAAILGGLIGGIFDHYFFSLDFHHSVTIFWLMLGLATAATQLLDAQEAQRRELHPDDGWSLSKVTNGT